MHQRYRVFDPLSIRAARTSVQYDERTYCRYMSIITMFWLLAKTYVIFAFWRMVICLFQNLARDDYMAIMNRRQSYDDNDFDDDDDGGREVLFIHHIQLDS
ncbi:unnamed protein product [Caenorhabditis bovis]|uniref:Uncharacterized protein n=1 Tax=Caenorhabditis bovis TaxID=2654633 RepID=A0A8S1FCE6_9PELO|nr:unnamed protein product [Caenorhabditis bovis]